MSQYKCHTDEMIQYLEQYRKDFQGHKNIFKEYWKDKSTTRKVREVTTRIWDENSQVLNQHRLSGATAAKRRRIADEQRFDLDSIVADIYISEKTRFCIHTHLNAPCSGVCIWSASCASPESSFKLQKPKWTCKCCPLGLKIHVCLRNC